MRNWLHRLPGRRLRRPLHPVALGIIAALALPASAHASSFTVTLHIANHAPIVNKKWPIAMTITKGSMKLSGTIKYEFLFNGSVVSTQPIHGAYKFKDGIYKDELLFPTKSLGQPLTLRFVVRTKFGTEHADWRIRTRMPPTMTTTAAQQ